MIQIPLWLWWLSQGTYFFAVIYTLVALRRVTRLYVNLSKDYLALMRKTGQI